MPNTILIVEDEITLRDSLMRLFQKNSYRVEVAGTAEEALGKLEEDTFDIIISDITLPGIDGIEMMTLVKEAQPRQIFIIMTAYASLDTAVRALRLGAYDYIMKPIMHEEIKQVVLNAIKHRQLERENVMLKRQMDFESDYSSILGTSSALADVIDEVKKVADSRSNVLLLGETGTGKELFARIIHHNSSRRDMPFVPINCSAIPEPLIESELFGHTKGAFTGAIAAKIGLLEEADGGTVFLDEIGDMPKQFQVKLLRTIEDREVRGLGSSKSRTVDVRFITATNRDLSQAVQSGEFREDFFYRINVINLRLPPLRERKEDIQILAGHFMEKFVAESGKSKMSITHDAMAAMTGYSWPGNIRELQNVMERAVLISEDGIISTKHLPESIFKSASFFDESQEQGFTIDEYTRSFITKFQHKLGEGELAEKLGITRKTLWEKRKKWGMKKSS